MGLEGQLLYVLATPEGHVQQWQERDTHTPGFNPCYHPVPLTPWQQARPGALGVKEPVFPTGGTVMPWAPSPVMCLRARSFRLSHHWASCAQGTQCRSSAATFQALPWDRTPPAFGCFPALLSSPLNGQLPALSFYSFAQAGTFRHLALQVLVKMKVISLPSRKGSAVCRLYPGGQARPLPHCLP